MKLLEYLAGMFGTQKMALAIFKVHRLVDSVIIKIKSVFSTITIHFSDTFSTGSVIIAIKFLMSIALLIFIRGGLPRYRFDHLTKVG
jgi:NADH:ubiquinone oxidoreductase subunit H